MPSTWHSGSLRIRLKKASLKSGCACCPNSYLENGWWLHKAAAETRVAEQPAGRLLAVCEGVTVRANAPMAEAGEGTWLNLAGPEGHDALCASLPI